MTATTLNNKATARKVVKVIDEGLCSGLGEPKPGAMCIIAAKRFACGLSHGDGIEGLPIGSAVRSFEITLNDCNWSSPLARAKGMRRLSVAEWGSDTIDQKEFVKLLALKTINTIVPIALRAAAKLQKGEHVNKLEAAALNCEKADTLRAASDDASDAARAASDAASYAARAASYAASAASYAARAARAAASDASDAASDAASYAARAASYAARAARAAASAASDAARDKVLAQMAEIAVQALIELKSPGAKWLSICDE